MPMLCQKRNDSTLLTNGAHHDHARQWRKAYIALGSNVGDELGSIEQACDMLDAHHDIRILRTSCLYPTKPMYVTDQDEFLNAACELETSLSPIALLDALQHIEKTLGRIKTIDKGPRSIDLDILLYEDEIVNTERLKVPHALMHEREFVLRPLADMIPDHPIPTLDARKPISAYLADLPASDPPMTPMIPFGNDLVLRPLDPKRKTQVMAVLNLTPDSFSDGGKHLFSSIKDTSASVTNGTETHEPKPPSSPPGPSTPEQSSDDAYNSQLTTTIRHAITSGADMLDIGGQSSRPNAPDVSAEEEYSRIAPALSVAQRICPRMPVSIDTYRRPVFERAITRTFSSSDSSPPTPPSPAATRPSPASTPPLPTTQAYHPYILNDISACLYSPSLLPLLRASHASVILMHLRGTPSTMSHAPHTGYPSGVIAGVATELLQRVAEAQRAGVRRWRIVLDPGIGFAKTPAQNLELLRGLAELRRWKGLEGFAWCVGSSRKGFVGGLLGRDDEARREGWRRVLGEDEGEGVVGGGEEKGGVRGVGDRDWGTAATVVAAVAGGADIVRVHNVRAMRDVVAVADAVYRS